MKINDIVAESKGEIHPDHNGPMKGTYVFRDNGVDRGYNLNRVMMAAAMADGKSTDAVDMPEGGWSDKYNTAHPYTDAEHKMLQSAFKTVPSNNNKLISDNRSKEPSHVHKISPIKGFKGYTR
jgi:hypothetical protein